MLGSISPVGEASRSQRWWLTATAHAAASLAAGTAFGTVLGVAGAALLAVVPVDAMVRLLLLAGALAVAVAVDIGAFGAKVPTWHRQVDETWLGMYRGWVYGAGYGAQLGVGVATIVPSAAVYATLAAALLSASWRGGLIVGAVFGAVRSVPLLLMAGVRSPQRLHTVTRGVAQAAPRVHRASVLGQGAIAVAVLVAAVGHLTTAS